MISSLKSMQDGFKYYPIKVDFCGLVGDTLSMRQNGWTLNVESRAEYQYDGVSIYIAGKHDALKLRFLSGVMTFSRRSFMMDTDGFLKCLYIPCVISSMSNNIIVNMIGKSDLVSISNNWSGVIGTQTKAESYDLDDLFHFPTSDDSIIVPESKIWTIEEHLAEIRKAQAPFQEELLRMDSAKIKTQTKETPA